MASVALRTASLYASGSTSAACPCGCGDPVVRIEGGFSTPARDMRDALVWTAKHAPAIVASALARRQGENPFKGT